MYFTKNVRMMTYNTNIRYRNHGVIDLRIGNVSVSRLIRTEHKFDNSSSLLELDSNYHYSHS